MTDMLYHAHAPRTYTTYASNAALLVLWSTSSMFSSMCDDNSLKRPLSGIITNLRCCFAVCVCLCNNAL
jgi:hypothetical protein